MPVLSIQHVEIQDVTVVCPGQNSEVSVINILKIYDIVFE